MANRIRTIDFLPEIFRTDTNRQFLSATLDQLVQEPKLKATQGYIGRRVGPGVNPNDSYIPEPNGLRTNYQLEPSLVFLKENTNSVTDALTYPGLIDSLSLAGADTQRHDRLFKSEYYSWDPFIDFDKFVNFGQYYWLPQGPDSVDVSATDIPLTNDFTVTRTSNGYTFSGSSASLPTITLVREGNYTFDVNQLGNPFYIQSVPGADGTLPQNSQSSREVLGVTNNGEDVGTVTFNVPGKTDQNFYFTLADGGRVDLVTDLQFNQVNNILVSSFLAEHGGIDGINDLNGRTVIFTERVAGEDGGWIKTSRFDPVTRTASSTDPDPLDGSTGTFDTTTFDQSTTITTNSEKYSVWQIAYVYDENEENPIITLNSVRTVAQLSKVAINYGTQYASTEFWKTSEGYYEKVPLITANLDVLYYQDVNNPNFFGVIKLVDQSTDQTLDVTEILASSEYTSPNGVVFTNGLKVQFEGNTDPASYSGNEYYVEGVGAQIKLVSVDDLITPETYTQSSTVPFDSVGYDIGGFDDTLNAPTVQDYFTINRASPDLNAWTRSNRWFHIDVINATATYNNTTAVVDNAQRAKRPILEFKSGLRLYNFGTESLAPIDIIDFQTTDAFSNVNGTTSYNVDGYSFAQGTRVIFANDIDTAVKNKVYVVNFVQFDDSSDEVIDLQPADINSPGVFLDQTVVVKSGVTSQGKSYTYNGSEWVLSQEKINVNQEPLFDVFDSNGYSYSNTTFYPSSDFEGSKLFSYATGTGTDDTVLGQPLKYLTIANVGDIVFENNMNTDTFVYTQDTTSVTLNINNGFARQYSDRTNFSSLIGWLTSFDTTSNRQSFEFEYSGENLILDVEVINDANKIPVKVYVNGTFVLPSSYTYFTNSQGVTEVSFLTAPSTGSLVEVSVISTTASQVGYYSVASNLEKNAFNQNKDELTLGTIRNHYDSICQNIVDFSGSIHGANNSRDLGNLVPYGDLIVQQSSPLTLTGTFLHNEKFDFFEAVEYAGFEYEKFKNLILDNVANNDWQNYTTAQILDQVLLNLNVGKNENSPFYWSDMIPHGETYDETVYTVSPITNNTFDTLYSYNFNQANYSGILVYLNDEILVADDHEYSVASDGPRIIINVPLVNGDVIKIREYTTTYGSFVPATPTSLGLYKAYEPELFLDNTYVTPTNVILGHDGSITVAFGDVRDDVLLEFEKRIYNNLKVDDQYNPPIKEESIIPGQFRTTDYTLSEINSILSISFLSWVGQNKLPYKDQTYDRNNPFTYNYSNSKNKLDNTILSGGWRAIYKDLYDTDSPHLRPWEMLGLTEIPDWWEDEYGVAPYTSGNLVLWEDLRDGKIADPNNPTTVAEFARPNLLDILPVDSEGNLRAPFEVIVGEYDQSSFRKSWVFGDQGPVETAWRRSSSYRFALQRLMALTVPAQYFNLFADRDAYNFNTDLGQYLFNNRFRIEPKDLTLYGDGTSKNSYINWIVDRNRILGVDSTTELENLLANLDTRLCYRMASFSDKSFLKIFTEKSSPNSLNNSLLLPDESYQLLLYKNPSSSELIYSSVIVQKSNTGYAVYGYNVTKPYFEILDSIPNGNFTSLTVGQSTARIAKDYKNSITRVPYGYEFSTTTGVVDFLLSYGEYLTRQGMSFDNVENNVVLTWTQMAEEFLYWSQQGWASGSIINLNPNANLLSVTKQDLVAESLISNGPQTALLNQNKRPMQVNDYVVERIENTLRLRALRNNTFSFLNAKFTAYEHLIVFDNTSIFNDLLYDPITAARQGRLLLNGYTTYDWNGTLDAQGFILNQDNIQEWSANQYYSKGEIVLYKNEYWSASEVIPPSESFDFNVWIKSDYEDIQKGLLPNIATKSDLIRNYYDTNTANLERDADLLGFGLIGFRPRQYMQNLNLDDISQVNLYNQFLGTKGTLQAAEIFSQANLNKEVAEYEIFENWAIQRATYGASGNRSYFELRLLEADLLSNPSTVAVINPQEDTTANQSILVEDLWKTSFKISDSAILPTLSTSQPDVELPTAGYVNWDDVEIKVFDINDLSAVLDDIDEIQVGTSIWVAKANRYDWNIYRTNLLNARITQVTDTLDGRCTLLFDAPHNLAVGDKIVIKYFDNEVNGAYEVLSVPGIQRATIELSLDGDATAITSIGIAFVLQSVRVSQASDISNLNFANDLVFGNEAWVDNDGTDHWAVYRKTNPFTSETFLAPTQESINTKFGTSVAQGLNDQAALVGAPGYNSNAGGVYAYNKLSPTQLVEKTILTVNSTGTIGFGDSLAAGNSEWAVSGAYQSLSNRGYAVSIFRNQDNGSFSANQLLVENTTATDSEFGYSVAISKDERWMYIGAPGDDTVYAYTKVTVQNQSLNFDGDGSTTDFNISATIKIDDDSSEAGIGSQQLGITVNNIVKQANVDWTYSNGIVRFNTPPNNGDEIRILRLLSKTFLPTVSTTEFVIEDLYTVDDIYSFRVLVDNVLQRPFLDYTYDNSTKTVTFISGGVTGIVVITSSTHWELVDTFTYAGITDDSSTNPRFGHSLATTTDGRQVIVGSPDDDPEFVDFAGTVQIVDRSVEKFQVSNTSVRTYPPTADILRTFNGPVAVKLNNRFLQPTDYNNNGEFTATTNQITFADSITLNVGDIIEIETNEFKLMQTIQSNDNQRLGKFGTAVDQCSTNCSVYIGMPNDSSVDTESGSVERWQNQARLFGTITSTIFNPTLGIGDTIRINNYDVTLTGSTVETLADDINNRDIPNVSAVASGGYITLTLVNVSAADDFIKLQVLPGIGDSFAAIGFDVMVYAQTIRPPVHVAYGHFGSAVHIDVPDATTLTVGAPDSAAKKPTTFDTNSTVFDSGSTEYFDVLERSGVAYTYNMLLSANASATNPSKFVFGQQIYNEDLDMLDQFGMAVNYTDGILLVGAPQDDLSDSVGDYGRVSQFNNPDKTFSWQKVYQQESIVDVELINSVFTYDRLDKGVTRYLDFVDPLQGKILGTAKQNIDYITGVDPAQYNVGTTNNSGLMWAEHKVGEIWWDTSTARFINYHQDSVQYKARRWGQLFPGSSIDVYQWTESDLPPAQYQGEGEVFSTSSYVIGSTLDADGLFRSRYFFWVKGKTTVDTQKSKTLSVQAIAQYIENPRSSGIAYIAAIAPNTVALYNCRDLVSANDTILHIEYDKARNNDNVHVEYDLVADGNSSSFLSDGLYRKLLDSFCGDDTLGNLVPDVTLPEADKYGVNFRPRQSLFVDRFLALENYFTRANTILSLFPIAESKSFNLLNSEESEPTTASGEWNKRLNNYAELTYQNLATVSAGYKYLVANDETQDGLWTIYTVQVDKTLLLSRVQNYDTKLYWNYINWVQPGYNTSINPIAEVATFNDLATVTTATEGDSVKVTANSFGKFEIYQLANGEWQRVVAENTTIEISEQIWNYAIGRFGFDSEVFDSQRFGENPSFETRQILKALNEEIFTGDQKIYKNELLILMFEYILTEQPAPDWLIKTSLVDVSHKIRDLETFQVYRRDNQDFVQEYINEVKPYHVKIKEFNLRYEGIDNYLGTLTDFDVPAYYDTTYNKFISPVLDDTEYDTVTNALQSHVPSTDPIWSTLPWSQWFDNYKLSLGSVTVVSGGEGYTVAPQVTVTGTAIREATLIARISTSGEVIEIEVVDAGEGYTTTPIITISGGNGSGAEAVAIMQNLMVRSFDTTLKFDRCEYTSTVVDWEANTKYEEGSLVRYQNKVYSVNDVDDSTELDSGNEFDPEFYTEVDQSTLSGADRTIGLYVPDVIDPGRELALLIAGVDYPGVQVDAPDFNQNTGFDIGNFDITPFDNIDFGPEGLPTYSPEILDTIYESSFTDTFLGTRATDINVAGGKFIDTYSSHAPEELIPGSSFDTLDLRVYTRPGSDWTGDGHGFDIGAKNAVYTTGGLTIEFGDLVKLPLAVSVENETLGQTLDAVNNFTVDWPNKRVFVSSGASAGDIIGVRAFDVGGGNQLFKQDYLGGEIGNSITIPVAYEEIFEFLIKVNGFPIQSYFYAPVDDYSTKITFANTYTDLQLVSIVCLGIIDPSSSIIERYDSVGFDYGNSLGQPGSFDYSNIVQSSTQTTWSSPIGEYFVYTSGTPSFTLTNSLQGTNAIDMVVLRNGFRLRPPESREHTGDGSSAGPYYIPNTGLTPQGTISENEVLVYVDNVKQTLYSDYTVSAWDGSSDRYVEFTTAPDSGSRIIVAVTTRAEYTVSGTTLTLATTPPVNTVVTVATFNDTSEQDLLTLVYQGPTEEELSISEGFDTIGFDVASSPSTSGSFDYGIGTIVYTNNLDIGRTITDADRLEVHRNGERLLPGLDYTTSGTILTLGGSVIGSSDVVVVTLFTQNVVPNVLNFRIFQDMLGNQKILRITDENTTKLAQDVAITDDIIYVVDASKLDDPGIEDNIFGVVTINGERITYKTRNTTTNTISGLRRGVAGTGISTHLSGEEVINIGVAQQLPTEYQQTVYSNTFTGDGSTTKFVATNVTLSENLDSTEIEEAVRVIVGGTELVNSEYTVTQLDPTVEVTMVNAPATGVEIEVYITKSTVMYAQSNISASNGIALQEQTTKAARFIRGGI